MAGANVRTPWLESGLPQLQGTSGITGIVQKDAFAQSAEGAGDEVTGGNVAVRLKMYHQASARTVQK